MPSEHGGQHFRLVPHSEFLYPYRLAIGFGKLKAVHSFRIRTEVCPDQGTHPHQLRRFVVTGADGECLYQFFNSAVTPLLSSPIWPTAAIIR